MSEVRRAGIDWLIGTICTSVYRHYPGNSTFEFGEGILAVDCLWRVVAGGQLRRTSGDDGQQYGLPAPLDAIAEAKSLVQGLRVISARLREATNDLTIQFEGGVELEVIAESSGYEPWNFTAPGVHLIAVGGGCISDFSPEV